MRKEITATNTDYEMWLTGNGESEKLQIPVLPEKFNISIGSKNSSVDIAGLGEITIKQSRAAYQFSFNSFFPAKPFPGMKNVSLSTPHSCVQRIQNWLESDKPVHVILTGTGVDEYCTIEKFSYYEQGGDTGTLYYDLTLKEYREITIRQVTMEGNMATVEQTETRVDNTAIPKTYTVKKGDCLWNIAKSLYGSGAEYAKIYEANKSVIGSSPNRIYPGQVLTIP